MNDTDGRKAKITRGLSRLPPMKRRNSTSDPHKFYPCDIANEPDSVGICCIWSELQVDEARPDEGSVRCARHGALIGTGRSIMARDAEHAREILRTR